MNINYVNYAVIVLRKGYCDDYNFYVDDKKSNVKKVNKEGTIVKMELKNKIEC